MPSVPRGTTQNVVNTTRRLLASSETESRSVQQDFGAMTRIGRNLDFRQEIGDITWD